MDEREDAEGRRGKCGGPTHLSFNTGFLCFTESCGVLLLNATLVSRLRKLVVVGQRLEDVTHGTRVEASFPALIKYFLQSQKQLNG